MMLYVVLFLIFVIIAGIFFVTHLLDKKNVINSKNPE